MFGKYEPLCPEDRTVFENTLYLNYEDEKRQLELRLAFYPDPLLNVVKKCEEALLRRMKQVPILRPPLTVYKQLDTFGNCHYLFR